MSDTPTSPAPDASTHEPMPEGEETPPPGVAVMAVVRWAIVAAMALAALASFATYFGWFHHASAEQQKTVYTCPMHPGVQEDRPGECPICGMTLVPKSIGGASSASAMPKAMPSATPSSAMPKKASVATTANAPYACPMHPDQTSTDPNAKCPVCGMKMQPRPAPSSLATTPMPTNVPGLVPIELTFERVQLVGMKTAKAERHALGADLRTVGVVAATEGSLAELDARVSGWIERLFVTDTGASVKAGQPLAAIYSPQIFVAEQELLASKKWAALPPLPGEDAGTAATPTMDLGSDARARLELLGVAKAEIDAIVKEGKPRRTVSLYAPRSGVVLKKTAVQGGYFQPGIDLFTIADLSRVWVLADVYEYELARVSVGETARLSLVAFPGETFEGAVKFVYPTVDASTRTARVRLELPNPSLRLRPGMYGDVTIALPPIDGLFVPREALVETGEMQYVFVATSPTHFEPRRVQVGARTDTEVQILAGVTEGETVVTTGNFLLDSESRLRATIEAQVSAMPAGVGGGPGPSCASDFDGAKFPDKAQQCRQCELVHHGMGTMEEDCKNAIAKPWK